MGTVTKVSDDDDTLTVEIAEGVRVQMLRSMLAEVRGKGEPVSKPPKKKASKAEDEAAPAAANQSAVTDGDETVKS